MLAAAIGAASSSLDVRSISGMALGERLNEREVKGEFMVRVNFKDWIDFIPPASL